MVPRSAAPQFDPAQPCPASSCSRNGSHGAMGWVLGALPASSSHTSPGRGQSTHQNGHKRQGLPPRNPSLSWRPISANLLLRGLLQGQQCLGYVCTDTTSYSMALLEKALGKLGSRMQAAPLAQLCPRCQAPTTAPADGFPAGAILISREKREILQLSSLNE